MKTDFKKILTVFLFLVFLSLTGICQIQSQTIISPLNPAKGFLNESVSATYEIVSDEAGQSYNVSFSLEKPNGETITRCCKTGKLEKYTPLRVHEFVKGSEMNQYGVYNLSFKDYENGNSSIVLYEVYPNLNIVYDVENSKSESEQGTLFWVKLFNYRGEHIDNKYTFPEHVKVFKVFENGSESFVGESNLSYFEGPSHYISFLEQNLDPGNYSYHGEVVVSTNISDKNLTNYDYHFGGSFVVKPENLNTTNFKLLNGNMEIALIFSMLGLSFFVLWIGKTFGGDESSKWGNVIRIGFILTSYLFITVSTFIAGELARGSERYAHLSGLFNNVLLAEVFTFLFLVLVYIVYRVKNSAETVMGKEDIGEIA